MSVSNAKANTSARLDYSWVIVAAGFLIYTVLFGIQYSFGIFFKPLQEAFGWPRASTSWVMTIHLICMSIAMVPAAWAIGRFRSRVVFSLAAVLIGGSLVLCSRISQLWQLYLVYGLPLGIGIGIFGTSVMSIVTRWFTQRRGLALGIASSGVGFGTLAVAPLAQALIAAYGWQTAFAVLGVASGVLLLICANYMKDSPSVDGGNTAGAGHQSAASVPVIIVIRQAMKTGNLYLLIAGLLSAQFTLKLILTHFAPHATDMGMSASSAALAVGIIGGCSVLGRLAMGSVQDRIGARLSMIICLSVLLLCMMALPFLNSNLLLFAFAVLFGFMYGGDVPQGPAMTAQCYGTASIVVMYGLVSSIANLIAATGPVFAGYLFDATGSYTVVFLIAAAALLAGIICFARLKIEK